jgi:ribosomal protein S18 acetylase RimI-like enzyme
MLRRATEDDVAAIAALFRRSFGTLAFLPTLHTPEEDRAFFGGYVRDDEVWVWEEDGRVLGFAALGESRLEHLYVEPETHNRGIGSALLAHAKERRPDGFDLWTFQRNEGARRFYDRHGFREVERTDGSGNEEREPDVRLEWRPRASAEPAPARRP